MATVQCGKLEQSVPLATRPAGLLMRDRWCQTEQAAQHVLRCTPFSLPPTHPTSPPPPPPTLHLHNFPHSLFTPVDCAHRHLLRDACKEAGYACLVGALAAGAQHAADHNVADVCGVDAGAVQHCLEHSGQQVHGISVLEAAALGLWRGVGRRREGV